MRIVRWSLVVMLAGFALGTAGCGGGNSQGGEITIGTSLPLTGQLSPDGKETQRGYEVWQKVVNERGGLLGRPVSVTIRDDASQPGLAVSDYNEFINQAHDDLLFGTFSGFLSLPTSAIAERNQMLYVTPAGGVPATFARGYHFFFDAEQAGATDQAALFAKWVTNLPKSQRPKTAAYVAANLPFTRPVIDAVRKKLEAAGITTVFDENYSPGASNFDAVVSDIAAKQPQLIADGADSLDDGVAVTRSLIRANYSPRVFFQLTTPNLSDQFINGIGLKNTEGIFSSVSYVPQAGFKENHVFLKTYHQMFGHTAPGEDAADAFATGQVVQAAVEAVGSFDDQTALADYLHSHEVTTILGPTRWDSVGRPQGSFLLSQWQNGKEQILAPKAAATSHTAIYPKPPWK